MNNRIPIRIGHGYDIHRLVSGRELWLAGVLIPSELGLEGHSDADVALHALCDAILGAAALRDIGFYFPPSNPEFKGISSIKLLKIVHELVAEQGYAVGNVDISMVAERPKLSPYIDEMKQTVADVLSISASQVGIKVTTNEGIDQIGRGEAICAHAVCILNSL